MPFFLYGVYFSACQASEQPTHDDSSQGCWKETEVYFCLRPSGSSPSLLLFVSVFVPFVFLQLWHSSPSFLGLVLAWLLSLSSSFFSMPVSVCSFLLPFAFLSCTRILAGWTSWPDGSLTVSVCLNSWWTGLLASCGNFASTTCGPSVYLSLCTCCLSLILFLCVHHLCVSSTACQNSCFCQDKKSTFTASLFTPPNLSSPELCLNSVFVLFGSVATPPICWCWERSGC